MTSTEPAPTDVAPGVAPGAGPAGPVLTRRVAIGAGLVAGAVLVTACGSGGGGSGDDELLPTAGASLGNAADVPAGGSVVVTAGKAPVALAKKSDGTVVAHTGVCTHEKCAVQADGAELRCPCHQSRFDAVSGAVLNGPAESPLAEIAIKTNGDAITVA